MRSKSAEQIAALDAAIQVFRSGFMSGLKGAVIADHLSIIRDRLVSQSYAYDKQQREKDKSREIRAVYREDKRGPHK